MLMGELGFRRMCHARDLLREMRDPLPTVTDIARAVGCSPFHFIRQFDAVFGATPHQYRLRSRLDEARSLLAAGELSVTDVCFEVGFSSLGSFSALFSQRVGESPSAYRRRVRTMVAVPGVAGDSGPAVAPVDLTPGCLTLMSRLPASAFASTAAVFEKRVVHLVGKTVASQRGHSCASS